MAQPPLSFVIDVFAGRIVGGRVSPAARAVGSVEDPDGNALAATVIGLFKAEVIHRRGPRRSLEAVEFATLEWIDRFDNRRLRETIGNIPPAEAEAAYYATLEAMPLAAQDATRSASGEPGAVQIEAARAAFDQRKRTRARQRKAAGSQSEIAGT